MNKFRCNCCCFDCCNENKKWEERKTSDHYCCENQKWEEEKKFPKHCFGNQNKFHKNDCKCDLKWESNCNKDYYDCDYNYNNFENDNYYSQNY